MKVEKLTSAHLDKFLAKEVNASFRVYVNSEVIKHVDKMPHVYAGLVGTEVIVCAGITTYWAGRGEAWAFLDKELSSKYMRRIHKIIKDYLRTTTFTRIEAVVYPDFEPGHRWAEMLGFTMDAELLEKYTPQGRDVTLYSLVKGVN